MTQITLPELAQLLQQTVGPQDHWWPKEQWNQIVIQSILIQNATGSKVEEVSNQLDHTIGFDLATWQKLSENEIQELIKPAGLYRSKAKYIKAAINYFAQMDFNPQTVQQLTTATLRQQLRSLPGIGNETADVWLVFIFNRAKFIADSYARRLFVTLGASPKLTYEKLQRSMEANLELDNLRARRWHASIDEFGKLCFSGNKPKGELLTDLQLPSKILAELQ